MLFWTLPELLSQIHQGTLSALTSVGGLQRSVTAAYNRSQVNLWRSYLVIKSRSLGLNKMAPGGGTPVFMMPGAYACMALPTPVCRATASQ